MALRLLYGDRILDTANGEIRLLTLRLTNPAEERNSDGRIECDLENYFLKDCRPEPINIGREGDKVEGDKEEAEEEQPSSSALEQEPRNGFWSKLRFSTRGVKSKEVLNSVSEKSKERSTTGSYCYIALSYVWGEDIESEKREILINGQTVKVRKNLHAALAQFRRMELFERGVKIWVDAIAINQDNEQEKSAQIQIMHRIYQSAGNVIVWLGPGIEDGAITAQRSQGVPVLDSAETQDLTKLMLQAMLTIENISQQYPSKAFEPIKESGEVAADPPYLVLDRWNRFLQGNPEYFFRDEYAEIYTFFTITYWSRLWIIQELLMGKADMPILWGKYMTYWRNVRDAAITLNSVIAVVGAMIDLTTIRGPVNKEEEFTTSLYNISHVAAIAQLEIMSHRMNVPIAFRRWENGLPVSHQNPGIRGSEALRGTALSHALQLGIHADCADRKDHIFGMLHVHGIPLECKNVLRYSDSMENVSATFAKKLLELGKVEIFELLDGFTSPTWIPDFAPKVSRRVVPFRGPWYAGSLNTISPVFYSPMLPTFHDCGHGIESLVLKGVTLVDVVDGHGAVQPLLRKRVNFLHPEFNAGIVQPSSTSHPKMNPIYNNEYEARLLIACALTGGTDLNGTRLEMNALERLMSCFGPARPPNNDPDIWAWDFVDASSALCFLGKPLKEWLRPYQERPNLCIASEQQKREWSSICSTMASVKAMTRGRRLFITKERGFFGLGPMSLQVGDVVGTAWGCPKPLIFRRTEVEGIWRLQGECFTFELMQGEPGKWQDCDKVSLMIV